MAEIVLVQLATLSASSRFFRLVICNPLISLVRLVVRLVQASKRIIRLVAQKPLINYKLLVRLVFIRLPPNNPHKQAVPLSRTACVSKWKIAREIFRNRSAFSWSRGGEWRSEICVRGNASDAKAEWRSAHVVVGMDEHMRRLRSAVQNTIRDGVRSHPQALREMQIAWGQGRLQATQKAFLTLKSREYA